jgi:hypothetical protein
MLSLKASIIRDPKTGEEKLKLGARYITKDGVVPIAALREEIPFPGPEPEPENDSKNEDPA